MKAISNPFNSMIFVINRKSKYIDCLMLLTFEVNQTYVITRYLQTKGYCLHPNIQQLPLTTLDT